MNKISIIIPILNEAGNIKNLLNHLIQNSSKKNISEIIVVDGGSTDGSQNVIKKYLSGRAQSRPNKDLSKEFIFNEDERLEDTRLVLLNSPKGRAKQMNLGTKNASGNILYFLHVDSFPPKNFDNHIINQINKNNNAGCFIMKFNSKHWWLKLAGALTRLPFKFCRGGDQSLFITKSLFKNIGGFDERFKIYEDNDLIRKLYARKQFVIIKKWLTTSPRHYSTNGVWRLQYHYWTIHLKKWMGASPEKLNQYYLKYVKC